MRKLTSLALGVGAVVFGAAFSDAAVLGTQNTVVVLRVGDGSAPLAATATAVFLDEYSISYTGTTPTGAALVQTIAVSNVGGTGSKLTLGGTASAEGGLSLSSNGSYFMFGGYDSLVGGGTTGAPRKMVGRLDLAGNVTFDAIYGAGTTSAGNAIRTVTSSTGNEYWFGMSASPGIAYRTWEGGNNSLVSATSLNTINTRRLDIYNGQLYVSNASGTNQGVSTVGSGLPTTTGQSVTILPGMPIAAGPSSYDFFFADANTLYVADDRTSANGGLQKWTFDGSIWSLIYTKNIDTTNDALDNGMRGLTGSVDGSGNVTLFGTSTFSGTVANFLVGISDTLTNTDPSNVSVNSLAAAGASTTFRGLEAVGVVVPEPASLGLLAGGMLLLGVRRRR